MPKSDKVWPISGLNGVYPGGLIELGMLESPFWAPFGLSAVAGRPTKPTTGSNNCLYPWCGNDDVHYCLTVITKGPPMRERSDEVIS